MRERLVLAFTGLALAVVVLYAVPRAYFLADLVEDNQYEQLDRTAMLLAWEIDDAITEGRLTPELLGTLRDEDERIFVTLANGTVVSDHEPTGDELAATRPLADGGTVTVAVSRTIIRDKVADALLPLVVIGLGLMGFAALAGFLLARRLAKPFIQLAEAAGQLGTGRRIDRVPSSGIPEAAAVSRALTKGSEQIEALLQHERDVALNASHELRTPIAGLRLSLEDLSLWKDVPSEARAEVTRLVGEVDRLSEAVTSLLEVSHEQTPSLELEPLLREALSRHDLSLDSVPSALVPASATDLSSALDAFLDLGPSGVACDNHGTHLALVGQVDPTPAEDDAGLQRAREAAAVLDGRVVVSPEAVTLHLPVSVA